MQKSKTNNEEKTIAKGQQTRKVNNAERETNRNGKK